jgi:ribosomal protein S18 acetylase RimI-like enzyme
VPRYVPTAVDDPVAQAMLTEYFDSRELGFSRLDKEYKRVMPDSAAFVPPAGIFLVVYDENDEAVGCGGVRMLSPDRGEIKHLYLRESTRGKGWGRTLLTELEVHAFGFGAKVVVLDTNASLEAAQQLYRTSGYVDIEPYNDNPNATNWFEKPLSED